MILVSNHVDTVPKNSLKMRTLRGVAERIKATTLNLMISGGVVERKVSNILDARRLNISKRKTMMMKKKIHERIRISNNS